LWAQRIFVFQARGCRVMMNWKAQIRLVSRVFAATVLASLIVSAILFGLVQTNWGIKELARLVSNLGGELSFLPGRVSGVFPFCFELERLSIADAKGVWLEAQGIKVHWSPLPLIKGRMYFEQLVTASVNFDRPPALRSGTAAPFPSWIFAFRSDCFAIDRLGAGKELLGEPAVLKLDGRIPLSSPGSDLEAHLRIERTDQAGTVFLGRVRVGNDGILKIHMTFEETEHGLLGKALGIQGPLSLAFLGEGSLEQCKGRLRVAVPLWGQLESDWVAEGIAVNPVIRSQGRLSLTPGSLPPSIQVWLDRDTPFDLQARLVRGSAFVVERFELQARDLGLILKGTWDFEKSTRSMQFLLSSRELNPLKEVLGFDIAGTLHAEGAFSEQDETMRFSATGSVDHFQVQGSKTPLGEAVSWDLVGEGSPGDVYFFKRIKIAAENLSLDGAGEIRISESSAALDAFYEVKDLRFLSALESFAGWSTQGKTHLSWDAATRALSSRFQGKLKPWAGFTPPFLAKEVLYAGTLSLEQGTTLNLTQLEMVAPWGKLQGQGKAQFPQGSLEATWHLLLPDLGPFSATLKGGPAEVRGKVQGPLKALTLSADAVARGLSVSGFRVDTGHVSLQADMGSVTQGNVKVDAQTKELALRGQANFDLSDQHLNLKKIFLQGGRSTLTGALSLFLDTSLVEGELKAECNDLSDFSSLLHEKLQGSALLQARLFPSGEEQQASFLMEARNLEWPLGKALRSRIEAHGTLSETVPRGHMTLEIQDGFIGDLSLPSSTLSLEGDLGNTKFQLAAKGYYIEPFEIKGSGLLAISSAEERVTLNSLEGRYGGTTLSLLQSAAVARSSEGINLGRWAVQLGSGQIQGSGYVRSTDLSLELRFDGVPVDLIPVQEIRSLSGLARGNARLSGSPARPEGTADLQIETLRVHDQAFPSAGLTVQASLRDNRLQATLLLQGLSKTPLRADVQAPFLFSMFPLMLATPAHGEITGTLKGEIQLENMASLAQLNEQRLAGVMELDLGLEGLLGKPRLTGWIQLKNGSYENLRTGTILKEIEVDIAARTPMLVVNKATASDGETGRLSAQGQFEFIPEQGFRFKLDIALEKAKLFRYDRGTAVVGGDLTLIGSLSEGALAGQIRVDPAEFRIPERLAPEIYDLKVIEINKPGETRRHVVEAVTPSPWPLSLSLTVHSPGRVFLSGRGLDSEWQGEIQIKGTAAQPAVTGALSLVRGNASFLGKRFELKKGLLLFSGSTPPFPTIDVEAEAKSKEITARLQFTGPVQSPEMKLTSDPPLPPDEILSRLLFGRSASNITPLQAIQLADSINTLAGGGGVDLLGRTRQALSLDQLSLEQAGKNQDKTALSAGKYLSEDVYLKMQQGISPETGKATLTWEITPNVSVETEVGVNAEAGIGVNWRWDY
jgi:translocation and assembly module TamB